MLESIPIRYFLVKYLLIIRSILHMDGSMYVEIYGDVPREFISTVKTILAELYRGLAQQPELIEVYIYESTEDKLRHLAEEASTIGVPVIGDYPVSHEAWMGWPRIYIDYEKCKQLSYSVLRTLLFHEGVHSLLHGNISSYVILVKGNLIEQLGENATEVVYVASTVVKDIEVHCFLASKGLDNVVKLYYEHVSGDLPSIRCSNPLNLLGLMKLIAPCTCVECSPNPAGIMSEECKAVYERILEIARRVAEVQGNLNSKINMLIEELLGLLEGKGGDQIA